MSQGVVWQTPQSLTLNGLTGDRSTDQRPPFPLAQANNKPFQL